MKANLLALLTTLLITQLSLSARIVNLTGDEVKVEEGESFRLISFRHTSGYSSSANQIMWKSPKANGDGNETVELLGVGDLASYQYSPFVTEPLIIEGPGWVYQSNDTRALKSTVEILPTSEMQKYFPGGGGSSNSSSASGEQKNVTVIPENTPSNVQITLEQSSDLVNWSVAQPGSFAPSTTKRFFRIRSEQE